jgi:hypothetical protein
MKDIDDESNDLEVQKTFVLGKRILEDGKCEPSFFEMVLAKPGRESLITTIRKKFSLSRNDEMLQVVSTSDFNARKVILIQLFDSREIIREDH